MTRKEQIINVITKMVLPEWNISPKHKYYTLPGRDIPKIADAIMALSLDVPSEEEIHDYCTDPFDENIERCSFNTAKWMRDEILKRNSKDDFADV